MTLWIAWSMLVSALIAVAAFAAERVVAYLEAPRRFVWIAAIVAAVVVPLAMMVRREAQPVRLAATTSVALIATTRGIPPVEPPVSRETGTRPNTAAAPQREVRAESAPRVAGVSPTAARPGR